MRILKGWQGPQIPGILALLNLGRGETQASWSKYIFDLNDFQFTMRLLGNSPIISGGASVFGLTPVILF